MPTYTHIRIYIYIFYIYYTEVDLTNHFSMINITKYQRPIEKCWLTK